MDEYAREWKTIIYSDNNRVDAEGFHYKYVPKDAILSEEQISPNLKPKYRKNSKGQDAYMYVKKSPAPSTASETTSLRSPIAKLLSGLKPDSTLSRLRDSDEDDEDYKKIMDRKVSMNEQNVIGMNF